MYKIGCNWSFNNWPVDKGNDCFMTNCNKCYKSKGRDDVYLNMENLDAMKTFQTSPALLSKLKELGQLKQLKVDDVLLSENAYIRSIPLVLSGALRVIRTEEDGREILLYYIKPGESCIMSFLGGMHNDTSKVQAEVVEDAEVLFLPVDKVPFLIKEHPEWLSFIFKLYHQRFEELLEVINAIAFKKVDERMLDLLEKKRELTNSPVITITHEQLANELGTARVVVSRLLKSLEEDGRVELGRNKITLL